MRIRRIAGREDIRAILEVHARAWRAAYSDILPDETIEQEADSDPDPEHVEDRYSRLWPVRDRVFVAEADGVVRALFIYETRNLA